MSDTFWDLDQMQRTATLFDYGIGSSQFFKAIESELPPVFSRKVASQTIGGLMSAKTFSNLDALNQGPPKIKIGNRVGYERASFMHWLRQRVKTW